MPSLIFDLCAGTGNWSRPYKDAGYRVIRIDPILYGGDVRLHKFQPDSMPVRGILMAPPCTHFSVSGCQHWAKKGDSALIHGMSIVDACLRFIYIYKPEWWCLENPVGRLRDYIGPPVMSFNPCDYGDPYTKRTLLWGKFNNPKINPVDPYLGSLMWSLPSANKTDRAATPMGFSRAFFIANP